MKKIICFIIGWVGIINIATAQIEVAVKLDTNVLLIGDQTICSIKVQHPKNVEVLFPKGVTLGEKVEILNTSPIDTLATSPEIILKQDLLITGFDSGQHVIPPLPFAYRSVIGETDPTASLTAVWDTIYSKALTLNINTIPILDTSYVAPIKSIVEEPISFREDVLPYLIGGGSFLAIALLGFMVYKRRQKPVDEPEPAIILPPHEIAMNKLLALEKEELWKKGEVKQYQSELTHIVREYIENRYHVPALESTTTEILMLLKQHQLPQDLERKISDMLNVADLVKFAKAQPPHNIHERIMNDAKNFVEVTKIEEVADDEERIADL